MALIQLSQNENPLGPSPLAIQAAKKALLDCHRYPNKQVFLLKKNLAAHLGISPNTITLGNGAESLLELIGKTCLTTQDSALLPNYSFQGIAKIIQALGAK